jgi:hypothetical protein
MAKAIAKAVEIDGGEVWKDDVILLRINANGVKSHFKQFLTAEWNVQAYTVRQLPPADMSFDEAWECLKRGERVILINDGGERLLPSSLGEYNNGKCETWDTYYLKDKRFRKA